MGQEIVKEAELNKEFNIISGISRNIENIEKMPDVIIDFSVPEFSMQVLNFAKANKIPMVIGTTGFNEMDAKKIWEYSKEIPIFKSSNMSIKINVMANIVSDLSSIFDDSDIELIEMHHNEKADAPSGTALMIADKINENLNRKRTYEYNRHGKKEKRKKNEIGIHSIRGGSEVGKHTVLFLANNESLEISHIAKSRRIFASGALSATKFIVQKSSGFYSMNDLVKTWLK